MNLDVHMAIQRARVKTVAARAEAKLARLGGETAFRRFAPDLEEMTAEELDRDSASIRNILNAWRRTGRHANGTSTISLPSGRILKKHWNDNGEISRRELAVSRTPRHLRPKRRHQG